MTPYTRDSIAMSLSRAGRAHVNMSEIEDYQILTGTTADLLSHAVKEELRHGWEPLGGPFMAIQTVVTPPAGGTHIAQAMTKEAAPHLIIHAQPSGSARSFALLCDRLSHFMWLGRSGPPRPTSEFDHINA